MSYEKRHWHLHDYLQRCFLWYISNMYLWASGWSGSLHAFYTQKADQIGIASGGWTQYGSPQAWLNIGHAPLNFTIPLPICRQSTDWIVPKCGERTEYGTPQARSTFCYAGQNLNPVMVSDWPIIFHAFADNRLIELPSNWVIDIVTGFLLHDGPYE